MSLGKKECGDKWTNDHAASLKFGSFWMSNTLSSVTKWTTTIQGVQESMPQWYCMPKFLTKFGQITDET